jgi:hypothetical protein
MAALAIARLRLIASLLGCYAVVLRNGAGRPRTRRDFGKRKFSMQTEAMQHDTV